jgi:hypothetical protein
MEGSHSVSVLQGEDEKCYITKRTDNLEQHHIYFGAKNRKVSDAYGFWVWLTAEKHRGTDGVHGLRGHELDLELKQDCQRQFEADGHTRQEFMALIGKNYL